MNRNENKLVFKSHNDELNYYKKKCDEYYNYIHNLEICAGKINIIDFICTICHEIYDEFTEKAFRCNECYDDPCNNKVCLDCLTEDQLKKMELCKKCNKYYCMNCIKIENHECDDD